MSRFIDLTARQVDGGGAPDYSALSRRELDETLEILTASTKGGDEAVDRLQRLVHEMQVYRCELEMQNRALRDSQEEIERAVYRYSELYDSLPIGYLTLTPQGQIVEANATACETLHLSRDQLKGAFFRQFVLAKDALALAAHLAACNRASVRQTLEVTLTPRSGAAIVVLLSSCRSFPQAEVGFLIRTAFTDITDNRRTQQALQDAATEQEQFTHSISHDLRAPLITIAGFTNVLAEDHAPKLPGEVRDIVGRIRRAALRMEELLANLVQYSRLSRAPTAFETVDVEEILRDLRTEHQGFIADRHARLEVQAPLPFVLASRLLLAQALGHLLTNALKFCAPGKPPVVRITAQETEKTVVLTVTDEGIGIAPEHQERVFKIFEKLHTNAAYPGTGMGLALVRRATERMRGRVWLESALGAGTRFHLELPKAVPE